jgi:hypothetical protein
MRPAPRWRIGGRKARVTATVPNRLTSNCARACCSGTASTGPRTRIPAALISTSSPGPPVWSVIWWRARSMAAASVMSIRTGRTPGWATARASRASARRAAAKTRSSVSARRAVVARPIPPEAPVTRMKRATGGGAGLAGTGVAWVVMGSALRDGEGLIEVVVLAAGLFGVGSLRTPRAGSADVQAPRGYREGTGSSPPPWVPAPLGRPVGRRPVGPVARVDAEAVGEDGQDHQGDQQH